MIAYKKSKQERSKNKSNLKLTALIFAGLALASCKEESDQKTVYSKAKYDASVIKHEVHAEYLNCYPLSHAEKKACTEKVADKYFKQQFEQDYNTYKKTFQYESEKLGFKHFLNGIGLTCASVLQSPEFDDKEVAYLVKCNSGEKYYMQFDYGNKQWHLKG